MTELKNIGLITVLFADVNKTDLELANDGLRQNTSGITALANIPTNDTGMHTLANSFIAEYNKLHSKPPTTTAANLNTVRNTFVTVYNKNASFIQATARDAAISAGDVNVGVAMVENTGYYLKSPRSATSKTFDGEPEGSGIVRIITKAVAKRAIYVRQWGYTSAVNTPPEKCSELLIGSETELMLTALKSNSIIAVREAYLLPITRKSNDSAPETKLSKKATNKLLSKAHIRTYISTEDTHYEWGPWIYITVQ